MSGTEPAASAATAANAADLDQRHRPCFLLAALIGDLRAHPELDLDTLAHHLTQSDATAAEGYWHAAVNEARSFLEGLLDGILHAVCPDPPDKPSGNGAAYRKPLRCCRRSLLKAGFIDADKDELLQYVYGLASSKGCHPGATSEVWSRLTRRMVFTAGQCMIQHYGAWKSTHPAAPADPTAPPAVQPSPDATPSVPHKSRWRRPLSALTRLITRDVL